MSDSLLHMFRLSPHPTSNHHQIKSEKKHQSNVSSSSTPEEDSPLDFSTKKPKIERMAPRPFKAYPKDPMSFPTGMYGLPLGATPGTIEALIQSESNQAYVEFRKHMLAQTHASKTRRGGQRSNSFHQNNSHNILLHPRQGLNLSETAGQDEPLNFEILDHGGISSADESHSASEDGGKRHGKSEQQLKDEAYWERRRKNNEAAKRSRDARRAKEDEIAIRAAFLEQENLKLRFELCALKSETEKLRCILYSN